MNLEEKFLGPDDHDDEEHQSFRRTRSHSMSIREGHLHEDEEDHYLEAVSNEKSDEKDFGPGECMDAVYGNPVSAEEAAVLVPPGDQGLIWHAHVVKEDYTHPKHTTAPGVIKPRRPMPTVLRDDFFNSLTQTADGRWIFTGVLNGWPSLQAFELRSITTKVRGFTGRKIKRVWTFGSQTPPAFPDKATYIRVTLRAPAWSMDSYSADSKGNVWWFHAQEEKKTLTHGTNMIDWARQQGRMPRAVRAHHFHHRYARGAKPETQKDKLTYHAAVLLEWDHGEFCTVIELATLNGIGGRYGKSNWFPDKKSARPSVYRNLPASMVGPWMGTFAEIRCADVAARNVDEFKAYMDEYTGSTKRFLVPEVLASAPVRISFNGQDDIMRFMVNYISRDRNYTEEFRNCQAFAADFYGFICGKKGIVPTVKVNQATYQPRQYLFLYNPDSYARRTPYDDSEKKSS